VVIGFYKSDSNSPTGRAKSTFGKNAILTIFQAETQPKVEKFEDQLDCGTRPYSTANTSSHLQNSKKFLLAKTGTIESPI